MTDDPLIFTQSDMHVSNFGVDSFIARVAKLLCWPDNSNMESMGSL